MYKKLLNSLSLLSNGKLRAFRAIDIISYILDSKIMIVYHSIDKSSLWLMKVDLIN